MSIRHELANLPGRPMTIPWSNAMISQAWVDKCHDSQHEATLQQMRLDVAFAYVNNQRIICKSSFADESQLARDWVDCSCVDSVAEHLTGRLLDDLFTVDFRSNT